nr:hypothetical protein [Porphyromonas gulae]
MSRHSENFLEPHFWGRKHEKNQFVNEPDITRCVLSFCTNL